MTPTDKSTSYYVDIPQIPPNPRSDDERWVNVAVVATREEAERLLADEWGIPPQYSAPFIIQGEADLLPPPWDRAEQEATDAE